MTTDEPIDGAAGVLARLERAASAHDVEALVACFAPDYRNDTPAHPERSFTGREQVRRNWEQIFAFIPDLSATVLRSAINGDEVWSEWEHRGTSPSRRILPTRGVVSPSALDFRGHEAQHTFNYSNAVSIMEWLS